MALPPDTLQKKKQPEQSSAGGSQPVYSHRSKTTKCWPCGEDQTQPAACIIHPTQYESNSDAEIEVDNCDEGELQTRCMKNLLLIFVYNFFLAHNFEI